jgi:hypothetical protein
MAGLLVREPEDPLVLSLNPSWTRPARSPSGGDVAEHLRSLLTSKSPLDVDSSSIGPARRLQQDQFENPDGE